MNNKNLSGTQHLVFISILVAIIIIMSFTPLGYLKTAGLEITFILIPVVVGATNLRISDSALLGGVFGITSFLQCFGISAFGTTLLSINWFYTFIVCVIPRILAGWLGGLVFSLLKKIDGTKILSYSITCLATPIFNTLFFMSGLVLFFYNTDFIQQIAQSLGADNIFVFIALFVGLNGIIETIVCFIVGTAISKTLSVFMSKIISIHR